MRGAAGAGQGSGRLLADRRVGAVAAGAGTQKPLGMTTAASLCAGKDLVGSASMSNNEKTTTSTSSTQDQDAAKAASQALLKRQRERQRATLLKRRQRKSGQ